MMTRVLGVKENGRRIDIKASNKFGNMKKIMDVLDKNKTVLLRGLNPGTPPGMVPRSLGRNISVQSTLSSKNAASAIKNMLTVLIENIPAITPGIYSRKSCLLRTQDK